LNGIGMCSKVTPDHNTCNLFILLTPERNYYWREELLESESMSESEELESEELESEELESGVVSEELESEELESGVKSIIKNYINHNHISQVNVI
jgi:hypothetical protein